MPALYGGRQADQETAAWQRETLLVDKNVYVNRPEKPDPRGDDLMECDCRANGEREKGAAICTDISCFNRATLTV